MVQTSTLIAVVATAASLVQQGHAVTTYTSKNVSDAVNGLTVLHGHRGNRPYISYSEAFSKLRIFNDDSLETLVKNNQLKQLIYTQDDVDIIASTLPSGEFAFYQQYPLYANSTKQNEVTPIIAPDANSANVQCCVASSHAEAHLNLGQQKISTNVTSNSSASGVYTNYTRRAVVDLTANITTQNSSSAVATNVFVPFLPDFGIPILPSLDFFYHQAQLLYSFRGLGSPIAFRSIKLDESFYGQGARGYHIAYRTEDSRGNPNLDVNTVIIPSNNDNQHFVSFQNHEDGRSINCAQSYSMSTGQNDNAVLPFLNNNWVVIIPDYEGALAVFGANIRAGRSIINSIRSFLTMSALFNVNNNKGFLFGYSQGSTVTAKASEMVADYAPDVAGSLLGMSIGGFTCNLSVNVYSVNRGRYAGFIPMQLSALSEEYPPIADLLTTHVNVAVAWKFFVTLTCAPILMAFVGQDMFDLTNLGVDLVTHPTLAPVLHENSAGLNAPPFPVYIFQSTADASAAVSAVDAAVDTYCQGGAQVAYLREDNGLGHLAEEALRSSTAPGFFRSIIAGKPPNHCSKWQDAVIPPTY